MIFNKNGKFKIMQITDMQEIPSVSPDTISLLEAAVEAEKPDSVVYTGDQIKGYGVTYKGKGKELENAVAKTIKTLLEPVTKRNIPFAVTFGNHDRQVGISNKDQFNNIYKKLPNCIGEQAEGIDGGGTCAVPIKASDGSGKDAFNLYLFDSGTDAKGGGYEPFDPEIIKWYKKKREELKEKNGGYVPSIVFQHIPMCEYYNVLKRVKKSEKCAVRAFRTHKNEYYKLGDTCSANDIFLEPPSIPNSNTGEFDALSEKGDVLAVFVGHDHKNSFVGRYKNVDLGFTQSSGFNVYGNRTKRGVRIITIDEKNPSSYETYTRTFDELVGPKVSKPIYDYISSKTPETVDAAIPMIEKAVAAIAAAAVGIFIIVKLLNS
ncbi:MAG: metallophosphoesterase family protein [Clostridiales bacterium]|nr:metallophosphoesterase family protein [Clostridiales bacterium]